MYTLPSAPWMLFQSAPAIDGGRSRARRCAEHRLACFNPRPPSMAGDPSMVGGLPSASWFQSAPAIDGGRSPPKPNKQRDVTKFQSAPAIDGGRSIAGQLDVIEHPVSIRARHRWRAILEPAGYAVVPVSFQSAPAIDGGRSRPSRTAERRH